MTSKGADLMNKNDEAQSNVTAAVPVLHSTKDRFNGITLVQQLISSGTGAILTSLLVTPLDVVKIRLQAQVKPITRGECFLYCNGLMDHVCTCLNGGVPVSKQWYNKGGHFNGALDAITKIAKNEGVPKLWSGLSPTLIMAIPATVLYYSSYDYMKIILKYDAETSSPLVPMAAGGIARLFAVSVINPLELVRTKMQSRPLTFSELAGCIKTAVNDGGVLSLWRGWGPTVLRDVPFSCIIWLLYEQLKSRLMNMHGHDEVTFPIAFSSGAISGGIAAFLTTPFDVVKTHRQIELGEIDLMKDHKLKPTSTWIIMSRIYAESGTSGLFAGVVPRLVKIIPACAIMIGTYEFGKKFFRHRNEQGPGR